MTSTNTTLHYRRFCAVLLAGTVLGGFASAAAAQQAPAPAPQIPVIALDPAAQPTPAAQRVRSLSVAGN